MGVTAVKLSLLLEIGGAPYFLPLPVVDVYPVTVIEGWIWWEGVGGSLFRGEESYVDDAAALVW